MLDGRRATTHWSVCPTLAELFPAVRVEPDVLYVDDGGLLTVRCATPSVQLSSARGVDSRVCSTAAAPSTG